MQLNKICVSWALAVGALFFATSASALNGPEWPAPGGNTFSWSGGASAGDSGGIDGNYGGFDDSQFIDLYWGPQWGTGTGPAAGLDAILHDLPFLSATGTTAIWRGTTSYTNPGGGGPPSCGSCPIQLEIDISGLGANPWVLEASVLGLTALAPGIGAVVSNPLGLDFVANLQVKADLGSGYTAINPIPQPGSGGPWAVSSVNGAFYSTVPEPSTALLLSLGLVGLAAHRRRA